jgi:hypothetical protein
VIQASVTRPRWPLADMRVATTCAPSAWRRCGRGTPLEAASSTATCHQHRHVASGWVLRDPRSPALPRRVRRRAHCIRVRRQSLGGRGRRLICVADRHIGNSIP